jgi:hypothetical protein
VFVLGKLLQPNQILADKDLSWSPKLNQLKEETNTLVAMASVIKKKCLITLSPGVYLIFFALTTQTK